MQENEYTILELETFMEELKQAEQTEDVKRKINALEQQLKRRKAQNK
ncbi:hypothetical protein ACFLQL_03675 [Verrucomicrobiota bacterium]